MQPDNNILNSYLSKNDNEFSPRDYLLTMKNMINRVQDSPQGQKAVSDFRRTQQKEKGEEFFQTLQNLRNLESSYQDRIDRSVASGADETKVRQALDEGIKNYQDKLQNLGMTNRNRGQFGDEVNVQDVMDIYSGDDYKNVKGFVKNRDIFMPQAPVDPVEKMMYDMTLAHERGHAERMSDNALLDLTGQWFEREEEKQAVRDSINMLKENMERAGMEYDPLAAFRLITSGKGTDYVENPSLAPFLNRMNYLPVAEDVDFNIKDRIEDIKEARLSTMRSGLDITAPSEFRKNLPNLENINTILMKYLLSNED